MAFQAKDFIDSALIQKYARAQVDNPSLVKEVDANKMLSSMNDISLMQKLYVNMNIKVQNINKNITDIKTHNDISLMQKLYVNMNIKVQNINKNITDIKTHQYARTSFVLNC